MSTRPRNIGLASLIKYRFPVTAIASILHRASGVLLFLAIPFVLWAFKDSLMSVDGFAQVQRVFQGAQMRFWVWLIGSALLYHFLAGVKHLAMDLGYLEGKTSGRIASWVVMGVSALLIIGLGVRLW